MDLRIGTVVQYHYDTDIEKSFREVLEKGLESCQLVCWDMKVLYDLSFAEKAREASKKTGLVISAFWCGYSHDTYWNFYEGQKTLGIVPKDLREDRTRDLLQGLEFARVLGNPYMATHVGYIPENPYDENYAGTLEALKTIITKAKEYGITFLFETGQETPVTLLRTIEDLKMDNVGINLDGANLILYGKANPVDALDVYGNYVRGVHVKDGFYPTDGHDLGKEVKVGEGKVNYPALLKALVIDHRYRGDLTIEREIQEGSPEQVKDIIDTKNYLKEILKTL